MSGARTVRVWVPDVWDVVEENGHPDRTVADVKAGALARAMGGVGRADPADFIMKYRGALVDDQRTLGELRVPDRGPLIVLPARRRPVV